MINSKKGQEMYLSVSPIYENSALMQRVFEAIGTEADTSIDLGDEVLRQIFPQTADSWGLTIWEQRLGLVTNLNEDIEKRRRKVIIKLQMKRTMTPETMGNIIKGYTGAIVNITENVAPYTFLLEIISEIGFYDDLEYLYELVMKIKPSHLAVRYKLVSKTKSQINYHLVALSGESITVNPLSSQDL